MKKETKEFVKFLFVSEALYRPFDEGIKNVAFSLYKQFARKNNFVSVTKAVNNTDGLEIVKLPLNKLFLNFGIRNIIRDFSPDVIFYLPEASITFNSFVRSWILKKMNTKSKVVMLGVKHIAYSSTQKNIISKLLKPDLLLLLGSFEMEFFQDAGQTVKILPPAVDSEKFYPATIEEKIKLRADFNIPKDKTVVLHVGHIRSTRNVLCLTEVQKIDKVQVVIIGSTSTVVEKNVKERLVNAGIRIIDYYIPDISMIYKLSDIYTFPVVNEIACIDMPLSVLEAMACNLPVITTRFGGLVHHFQEDKGLRYFDTIDELVELVKLYKKLDAEAIRNNVKVASFTWDRFVHEAIVACHEVI